MNALILSSVVYFYSVFYLCPSFSRPLLVLNMFKISKKSKGSPYHTYKVYTKRDEAKKYHNTVTERYQTYLFSHREVGAQGFGG